VRKVKPQKAREYMYSRAFCGLTPFQAQLKRYRQVRARENKSRPRAMNIRGVAPAARAAGRSL